jgi:hypothetical protein
VQLIKAVCAIGGALVMGLFSSPVIAQRPSFSHTLVVESPKASESALRDRLREGYACAAVARPLGQLLSSNIAVVLTRERTAPGAAPARDVRVISGTPGSVEVLEKVINDAASQGFGLCGLTITAAIWGKPAEYALVAVMTREGAPSSRAPYRVIRTRGRGDEWAVLEKAAADGFAVSRLIARSDGGPSNTSDIVFVLEKPEPSRPRVLELAFAGNDVALQKEIDKKTVRGFCIEANWATPERVNVLLAKPVDGACEGTHEYTADQDSRFYVSNLDGMLLGLHRFKEGSLALYDKRKGAAFEYNLIAGELQDWTRRPLFLPRDQKQFIEKLDVDGGRGYRPVDVTWRKFGSNDMLAVDVVMARPRQ